MDDMTRGRRKSHTMNLMSHECGLSCTMYETRKRKKKRRRLNGVCVYKDTYNIMAIYLVSKVSKEELATSSTSTQ